MKALQADGEKLRQLTGKDHGPHFMTFELPVSDVGMFVAGEIGPDSFDTNGNQPYPKYGVIVWYESKELAKEAVARTAGAHWTEKDGPG